MESSGAGAKLSALSAGSTPPEFALALLKSGEITTLNAFRGKVVLVNFWATWCAPCVAEMPALERLYQSLHPAGLEIVAVNVDPQSKIDTVKTFVEKSSITFPILLDPKLKVPPKFNVTGFPESFFIGRDGRLLSFTDPLNGKPTVRVISDRPWDSEGFLKAIALLLK